MPQLWRVVKRKHAATAFDGKAAQRFGGRWNSPGRRAVYASATKSLAVLEVLVHLDVGRPLPRLVAFTFDVDSKLVDRLAAGRLPRHWRTSRGLLATQRIGDEWLVSGRALALAVPSTIVPEDLNYVLNPAHPAFGRLRFGRSIPFLLDPRLVS
ncbi:MAG: RES family NAD+ phosphorylase [Deltaproteobacteria bacterium]|nr:RES family NAD+ phosphorylase [Deltaproteobacteria bacterium]MBI3388744.1 RES family NAD+ phosphorylase [Deltaproteobacteria bacterium]